jgi:dynein heavy chain
VAGPPGSGKSTIIQTLVDALCVNPRGMSRTSARTPRGPGLLQPGASTEIADNNHKLQKLFPLVVDDLALIFGHLNHNHDWVDGVFTSAWKKASRVRGTFMLIIHVE